MQKCAYIGKEIYFFPQKLENPWGYPAAKLMLTNSALTYAGSFSLVSGGP